MQLVPGRCSCGLQVKNERPPHANRAYPMQKSPPSAPYIPFISPYLHSSLPSHFTLSTPVSQSQPCAPWTHFSPTARTARTFSHATRSHMPHVLTATHSHQPPIPTGHPFPLATHSRHTMKTQVPGGGRRPPISCHLSLEISQSFPCSFPLYLQPDPSNQPSRVVSPGISLPPSIMGCTALPLLPFASKA